MFVLASVKLHISSGKYTFNVFAGLQMQTKGSNLVLEQGNTTWWRTQNYIKKKIQNMFPFYDSLYSLLFMSVKVNVNVK